MEIWSARFKDDFDRCEHLIVGLLIAGALEDQKQELVDTYGLDIFDKALLKVKTEYAGLLCRFEN